MKFLINTVIDAIGLMLIAWILAPHFMIAGFGTAIVAAIVLSFVNSIIRPIVQFFSLPITMLTFGLFILVVNGFMFTIVSTLFGSAFSFSSFSAAILTSILFSIYHWLVDRVLDR